MTHLRELHPEMGLTEEQTREMVASQASYREQALRITRSLCVGSCATFPTDRSTRR
jgi:hypothetical protein